MAVKTNSKRRRGAISHTTPAKKQAKTKNESSTAKSTNLNCRFTISEVAVRRTPQHVATTTTTCLVFDNIAKFLEDKLSSCHSVILVSPFLTSATPLKNVFSRLPGGVTVITAPSKGLKSRAQRQMIDSWSGPAIGSSKVLTLSTGRGRTKSLAHCKYVVGLDDKKRPLWATSGSYNITGGSSTNIESLICFHDKSCFEKIYEECLRIARISKPM